MHMCAVRSPSGRRVPQLVQASGWPPGWFLPVGLPGAGRAYLYRSRNLVRVLVLEGGTWCPGYTV